MNVLLFPVYIIVVWLLGSLASEVFSMSINEFKQNKGFDSFVFLILVVILVFLIYFYECLTKVEDAVREWQLTALINTVTSVSQDDGLLSMYPSQVDYNLYNCSNSLADYEEAKDWCQKLQELKDL